MKRKDAKARRRKEEAGRRSGRIGGAIGFGYFSPKSACGGFALREALVVVGLAALLGCLYLSGIFKARTSGRALVCENNARRLMTAWSQYATDHHDACVNNLTPDRIAEEIDSKRFGNWVNNVMTWCASDSTKDMSNTNLSWVKAGLFSGYEERSAAIYKCPADTFLSSAQRGAGWSARLRSLSMNGRLGAPPPEVSEDEPAQNMFRRRVPRILKRLEIQQPSELFVTIEENADSVDGGQYQNIGDDPKGWGALPGSYHDGACMISFADGHAELHRWQGPWVERSKVRAIPDLIFKRRPHGFGNGFGGGFGSGTFQDDAAWLRQRTSATGARH